MSLLWVSLCLAIFSLHQTLAMDVPAYADFDPAKFAGTWYTVGAGSDCPEFMDMKPDMKMGKLLAINTENGVLKIGLAFPLQGQCVKMNLHYEMLNPGHFKISEDENTIIKFVEADFAEFVLGYSKRVDEDGQSCVAVQLYARSPTIPPKAIPLFQRLMNTAGLKEENMEMLLQDPSVDCEPEEA